MTSTGSVSTGEVLTSLTVMVNVRVSFRIGVPLSVTRTVTVWSPGPWSSAGVHEVSPFGSTVSPAGPLTSEKSRVFTGTSMSVAVSVVVKNPNSSNTAFGMAASTGGVLDSVAGVRVTTTKKRLKALSNPSLTAVINMFVEGAWAAPGVHVITPLWLINAPPSASSSW